MGAGTRTGECLFVDDDPELVSAAIDLGYGGVVIERGTPAPHRHVPTVTSLREVVALVAR